MDNNHIKNAQQQKLNIINIKEMQIKTTILLHTHYTSYNFLKIYDERRVDDTIEK